MDARGNGAQIAALNDVPSANDSGVQINAYSSAQVTNGVIYTGSPVIVSVTAAFTITDVYRPVTYTGVAPGNPIIIRSVTHTTAFPWVASTAYALGDVARPVTGNSHLYQCITAGTSGSTQPTWPTTGGTVTDGTAVWTDLGTAATAALVSGPSIATATGVTVSFGRLQAVQQFTSFKRHHILTSDGGTPSTRCRCGRRDRAVGDIHHRLEPLVHREHHVGDQPGQRANVPLQPRPEHRHVPHGHERGELSRRDADGRRVLGGRLRQRGAGELHQRPGPHPRPTSSTSWAWPDGYRRSKGVGRTARQQRDPRSGAARSGATREGPRDPETQGAVFTYGTPGFGWDTGSRTPGGLRAPRTRGGPLENITSPRPAGGVWRSPRSACRTCR